MPLSSSGDEIPGPRRACRHDPGWRGKVRTRRPVRDPGPGRRPAVLTGLRRGADRAEITDLRIRPWAGDPVSTGTAEDFNDRSVDGDHGALSALCGYRDRLQSAAESLRPADRQYQEVEDANAARMQPGC